MRALLSYILVLFIGVEPVDSQSTWSEGTWGDFESRMEQVGHQYTVPQYSVGLTYSSYKGFESNTPFETAKGYYQKESKSIQSYIKGITVIQNGEIKVTVDSINNIVAVNHPDLKLDQAILLDDYRSTREMVESLQIKKGTITSYQINYNKYSPVKKVELMINLDHTLAEIIIYYAGEREYENEDGELESDNVWMKIKYSNYSKKIAHEQLEIEELVTIQNKEYVLNEGYKNFEFIDFRLKE